MARLMSARKAMRYLGIRNTTFNEWVKAGVIPAHTDPLTGRVRYSELALDEWLKTAGNDNLRSAS